MCGLFGYLDLRPERNADKEILARMSATLVHRGPDSAGYFLDGALGLGFRRLAIIDPENSDQPILNEDSSIVLICNGEIFNYVELRKVLLGKGHHFRTQGDVEVLLHM